VAVEAPKSMPVMGTMAEVLMANLPRGLREEPGRGLPVPVFGGGGGKFSSFHEGAWYFGTWNGALDASGLI
jgi:hypothetical protein